MSSLGTIWVELGLNLTKFDEGLRQAEAKIKIAEKHFEGFEKIGDRLTDMGKKLSVAVTLPIVGIGTAAAKMAMDAVESENLFEVSMGNMASSARAWSEDLRRELGLNAYEIRKNVGTFNVMLSSMGLGEEAAYGMAKGLTQLAYDMASFYNLKPEEAFQKLQSGISGEIEPLKRLGIVVSETTVKTFAYTHGIADQGEELSEQQKILARYGVIMEATSKAQGDMARTLESPSNQLRVLKSRISEASVDLGVKLLPAFEKGIKVALDLVAAWERLSPEIQNVVIKTGMVVAAFGPFLTLLGGVAKGIVAIHSASTLAAVPIGNVVFAIKAVAGGAATVTEALAFLFPGLTSLIAKFAATGAAGTAAATGTAAAGTASAVATPAVAGLGAAVNFLLGPWGLLIAGVAGLVFLLSKFKGTAEDTTAKMQRLEQEAWVAAGTMEGDLSPSMLEASDAMERAGESARAFYTEEEIATQKASLLSEGAGRLAVSVGATADTIRTSVGATADTIRTGTTRAADAVTTLQERISEETNKIDVQLEIVRSRFELLAAGLDPAADASVVLTEKLTAQRAELALVGEKIESLTGAYERMKALKGENAEESLKLQASILKEQKAYADLQKEILATNAELRKQAAYKAGKPWEAEGRTATKEELERYANQRAVETQIAGGGTIVGGAGDLMDALKNKTPNYAANVVAIAKAANVDMGVADAMMKSHLLKQYRDGLIKLAAGGIIHKPVLLSDLASGIPVGVAGEAGKEVISPLNGRGLASPAPAPITITITGNHIASDYDVDRIGERIVQRLRLAGVMV